MTWQLQKELKRKLTSERGTLRYPPGARRAMALGYPNTYYVGMSNLGLHILYREINQRGDTACERFFLPDKAAWQEHVKAGSPVYTMETQRPLGEFPLVAFAVSFELDYVHLVSILHQSKIPLRAAERGERDPLVIVGGPCATFNPEPLADLVDVCVIGEGEEVVHQLLDVYYSCKEAGNKRVEVLQALAQVPGLYVPSLYQPEYDANENFSALRPNTGVPATIARQWIKDLDAVAGHMAIQTEDTEFGDMFLLEVARGCGRHCRFCMAGYCFRRPRYRSARVIMSAVRAHGSAGQKIGLVGAAVSDHPEIETISETLLEEGYLLSMASLRADSLTAAMVDALVRSGHRTLTLAPEAATRRLRNMLNKGIQEEDLLRAVDLAIAVGIPNLRLYIMVGLPTETADDVQAIGKLARTIRVRMSAGGLRGKLTLSVNPFIPKPFTPFQWLPVGDLDDIMEQVQQLKKDLGKEWGIEVLAEKPSEAYVQAVLARGDRRLGEELIAAAGVGVKGLFKRWRRAPAKDRWLYRRQCQPGDPLPWDHLDIGVRQQYLAAELVRAMQEEGTPVCSDGCKRCGVC